MNKKLLLLGAATVAGFMTVTAFKGKTLAEQKAEIAAAVTERLNDLRAQKEQECTDRVMAEAQSRYDRLAVEAEQRKAAIGAPKKGVKAPTKKSPTLPAPKPTTDPQKTRSGAAQPGDIEQQKTRSGAAPTTTPPDPVQQKKRPGAAGGGGN